MKFADANFRSILPLARRDRLLLLPGLDGTGALFDRFLTVLSKDIETRTIRYPDDSAMGYPELVGFVERQLSADKSYLLAESFSGPIALEIAALQPARISGLILASTFSRSPLASGIFANVGHDRFSSFSCGAAHIYADWADTGCRVS
jgi:pimeloyl-ACP methyl ester carboxylesterase